MGEELGLEEPFGVISINLGARDLWRKAPLRATEVEQSISGFHFPIEIAAAQKSLFLWIHLSSQMHRAALGAVLLSAAAYLWQVLQKHVPMPWQGGCKHTQQCYEPSDMVVWEVETNI